MKEYLIDFLMVIVIVLIGIFICIFVFPLLTTNQVEYMALCFAILISGALVYVAIKRKS